MVEKVQKIWMDGSFVDWDKATVHILTHTLHYGVGVFEGIRCYETHDGRSAVFRLREHIRRLFDSAKICSMSIPFTQEEIIEACLETIRINKLRECYIRPIAFMGDGAMGLGAVNPTRIAVIVWKWGAYLGEEALQKGIRAKVSSFTRPGLNMLMSKGKVVGHYVNSVLAKREAIACGYQEAILLDAQGKVAEASGENIFLVREGVVHTPPLGSPILAGVTRDSLITILKEDLGIPLVEREIARDELYVADEIFLCGTAAEVTPVREVDERRIGEGSRGPITKRLQDRYFEIVRGIRPLRPEWLTYV
ncbi:MAG: branched-chain amino acid transaminase [Sandaracinaceae bacterium]|nr:branched-chain amino acid transaminase [Sandaracinaceae bacterium]MDW8245240.1 branched-chain amino acid transaminase [Sandaracinaceae bacterium]